MNIANTRRNRIASSKDEGILQTRYNTESTFSEIVGQIRDAKKKESAAKNEMVIS